MEELALKCDIELKHALQESVDGVRAATFSPMSCLCVEVAGTQLTVQAGLSFDLIDVVESSGSPTQLVIVTNVDADPRVSSTWVAKGVSSYMSMPVVVDGRHVGSLYVFDARSREYTDAQAEALADVAYVVAKRLERFLGPEREERRESLMRRAISPAFAELRNALVPLNLGTSDLRIVAADLLPVVNAAATCEDEDASAAKIAYEDLLSLIDEIARASARVREVVMVVEGLWGEGGRSLVLNELLQTAAGLALHSTRLVGGVEMPKVSTEYSIHGRRSVSVAGLSLLLTRAAEANASGATNITPLHVELETADAYFYLHVFGDNLDGEECGVIAEEVESLLLGDRDMSVSLATRGEAQTELVMRLTRRS